MSDLHCGDALTVLRRLPDCSVQCCVTSPPYWGLRDYGVAGQMGLEATPETYVTRMVEVFREVRRVLRDDGTLWLNMGDSYAQTKSGAYSKDAGEAGDGVYGRRRTRMGGSDGGECFADRSVPPGLKPKDLVGIPWRLAFALQADGWYLRSDIIWHKPNPMPESVRDRPTKAHEYVFLMSKSERYFWDQEAVREEQTGGGHARQKKDGSPPSLRFKMQPTGSGNRNNPSFQACMIDLSPDSGRNIRSVWTITPKPFKGAHFATFPPALVERCVKAGTSERGACPQCGKAWERVATIKQEILSGSKGKRWGDANRMPGERTDIPVHRTRKHVTTLGFRPACTCPPAAEPVPCIVLDPFIGSGTTAAVAQALGRDYIGIDLNPKYLTMAHQRVKVEQSKMVLFG